MFASFDHFIGMAVCGFACLCGGIGIIARWYAKHNPGVKDDAKKAVASKATSLLRKWLK